MLVVCDGWSKLLPHARVILHDGDATEGISHGMCERCTLLMNAELDGKTPEQLKEYAAYLANPGDQRG